MDFFEQNKALIITVLLLSVMLLAMYNIHLSNSNREMTETLVRLDEYEMEMPEEQEQETQQQEPRESRPETSNLKTHRAFNQDMEETLKNFESRLDEIFEKNSAEQSAAEEETGSGEGEFLMNRNVARESRERSDGETSSRTTSTRTGSLKNSSISFSLLGRRAVEIPNPVYTCDSEGKIVVNIKVNAVGKVIHASLNRASSTSTNECLIDKALEYASEALFSELPGRNSQIGTITYNFQG